VVLKKEKEKAPMAIINFASKVLGTLVLEKNNEVLV